MNIEVALRDGTWRAFEALVDSGADSSAFDKGLASVIYPDAELEKEKAVVVGGTAWIWKPKSDVRARLEGLENEFPLKPVFIEHKFPFWKRLGKREPQMTILGRGDFMRAWDVMLSEHQQRVWFRWHGE